MKVSKFFNPIVDIKTKLLYKKIIFKVSLMKIKYFILFFYYNSNSEIT